MTEHRQPHVIVVDDEPAMRRMVRRMLEPAGYDVTEAEHAAAAFSAIALAGPRDLLIADLRMPDVTGDEVARRFRIATPEGKVLYITGASDALLDQESMMWAGEAWLQKPFSRQGLLDAVSRLLSAGA
jgi:CheY-like chemotaxis protein